MIWLSAPVPHPTSSQSFWIGIDSHFSSSLATDWLQRPTYDSYKAPAIQTSLYSEGFIVRLPVRNRIKRSGRLIEDLIVTRVSYGAPAPWAATVRSACPKGY